MPIGFRPAAVRVELVDGALALDEALLDRLVEDLTTAAEGLMPLFAPRAAQYGARKAEDPTLEDRR